MVTISWAKWKGAKHMCSYIRLKLIHQGFFQVAYMKSRSRQFNINFKKKLQRGKWDYEIAAEEFLGITANAAYMKMENKIFLPSFALDGWIFNAQRPTILNIPSLCFLLGHEIFHGFDSEGHKYDNEGLCLILTGLSFKLWRYVLSNFFE